MDIPIEQVPAMIFAKDREGRYIYANASTLAFWGLTQEELIGKTDAELWQGEMGPYAETYHAHDVKVMESGKALFGLCEGGVRKSGITLLNTYVNKAPLRDASGRIVGVIGAFLPEEIW